MPVLIAAFSTCDTRRENPGGRFFARHRSGSDRPTLYVQYSSSGRKIPGLPNNRINEMIGGCEIRSISGERPLS